MRRPNRARRFVSADRRGRALALLSGVLLGVAFLPGPFGFLAWFAFVPLLAALDARVRAGVGARRLFTLGYLFGFAFYLIGIHWIALLSDVAITVSWLKYPAWIAAAAYLALFPAIATLLSGLLVRHARLPLAAIMPVAWVAIELLRASGEMGFPWFQPGYTQHAYVPLIQMASLGGVTLVTLWVLLLNAFIWRAATGGSRARSALAAVLTLLLPFSWGMRVLDAAPQEPGPALALVQGNIPGEIKWSGEHQAEILGEFLRLSAEAAKQDPRPTLIIWPETATGSYLRKQIDQTLQVARFAAESQVPVFSGFADYGVDSTGSRAYVNGAGTFYTNGTQSPVYAKRHLVPFGERMPFQSLIPGLGGLQLGQAEWTPGTRTVLFESEAGPFSSLICFESIFPDLSREDVRAGATWLANITNDEWFGNSAALYQHAAMAIFRATENHVPLARCANTGLTMLIDSHGRIVHRLPVFEPAVLVGALPARGRPTWWTRVGDWVGFLCALLVVAGGTLALARALTRRGAGG